MNCGVNYFILFVLMAECHRCTAIRTRQFGPDFQNCQNALRLRSFETLWFESTKCHFVVEAFLRFKCLYPKFVFTAKCFHSKMLSEQWTYWLGALLLVSAVSFSRQIRMMLFLPAGSSKLELLSGSVPLGSVNSPFDWRISNFQRNSVG